MQLKTSRILHAGYLFEYENTTFAFDPIFENPFSKNCYAFPNVEFDIDSISQLKLDAIFISHYHDDHFSLESLNFLNKDIPIYIFSVFAELLDLLRELGFKKVYALEPFRPVYVGPFEILPLEALDKDVDSIFHIKVANLNILHVVDSWIGPLTMERLLMTLQWDLLLWPMQTMRELEVIAPTLAEPVTQQTYQLPPEWIEQIQQLEPRTIIASSCQFRFEEWSWYNQVFFPISYAQFKRQIQEAAPSTQVLTLNPGESLLWDTVNFQKGERLSWIKPLGTQDVDYEFNPSILPQSSAEISAQLPSLNQTQRDLVHTFCQKHILERFKQLSPLEDSFFTNPQGWLLTLYDHQGAAYHYHYKIAADQIELTSPENSWIWMTEISEVKLFGALYEGESLTSIYIRVTPPQNADPLEDPLIRCLYEGVLGGYQQAQLEKIKKHEETNLRTNFCKS
ncbi:MAG: MBL fold metallo-hydrolase [Bdellovibrio sp.]